MARQSEKSAETETAPNRYSSFNSNRGWLYGLLGLLVLIVVFMAGVGIADHHKGRVFESGNFVSSPGVAGGFGERSVRRGGFGGLGGSVTSNGQTRTTGVVTSVNGSSFTLAGNGATTTVATTSSTQYRDGNQVKQNDSVIVFGTTSNGTLNAAQIVINP